MIGMEAAADAGAGGFVSVEVGAITEELATPRNRKTKKYNQDLLHGATLPLIFYPQSNSAIPHLHYPTTKILNYPTTQFHLATCFLILHPLNY